MATGKLPTIEASGAAATMMKTIFGAVSVERNPDRKPVSATVSLLAVSSS